MFFPFSQSGASKKKVAAAAKRGGKAAMTSLKSTVAVALDLENGEEKLANGVEALLISDLSL